MQIWFTSDLHLWLCHDKDFIYQARGYNNVEEMNNDLIEKWNQVVLSKDLVYILGDVALGNDLEKIKSYLTSLNGKKILIRGNHDTDKKVEFYKNNQIFENITYMDVIKYKKKIFLLSHYPQLTYNYDYNKVFSLYGHTHQTNSINPNILGYHVGIDSNNNTPVSLEFIYNFLKNKELNK